MSYQKYIKIIKKKTKIWEEEKNWKKRIKKYYRPKRRTN